MSMPDTENAIESEASAQFRILIVEDSALSVKVLRQKIEEGVENAHLTIVGTLADAQQLLARDVFDFIILDLNLPDSSGLNTLEQIQPRNYAIPVVVYTAIEDPDLALKTVKLGAQDCLQKGKGTAATLRRIIDYSIERKNAELKIYKSEQMLRMFIKHAPAGICVFDAAGKILMTSDRWVKDHGISSANAIGNTLGHIYPHDTQKWLDIHKRCMRGEVVKCEEDLVTWANGQQDYIKWEMMPWYNEINQIGGTIKFSEVITAWRTMQQALEDSKHNLEQKVLERTRELESAKQEAEDANRAKTEFFTNLTHELRTPLHAIINFSNFGVRKTDAAKPEKIKEYFRDINDSGTRLLRLVNDILDLSKHQARKVELEIILQPMQSAIDETTKELSGLMEEHDIGFVLDNQAVSADIAYDKLRIVQVLINLFTNAIKFSDQGSTIKCKLWNASDKWAEPGRDETGLVVSIMDQGTGIPEEDIDRVFDEFAQSSKVKSGVFYKGTGLGLAICREIIKAHHGHIWAENNPDKGACVSFVLPYQNKPVK